MTDMPDRIRALPLDPRLGLPTPWFVDRHRPPDQVDFRIMDIAKVGIAVKKRLCWVCGQPRGVHLSFVIGPMCAINRVTAEPPAHLDCARYSVSVCPFLSNPKMRRSPRPHEAGTNAPAGLHLDRNPGVAAIWNTRSFEPFAPHVGRAGILFQLGEPDSVEWYCCGRPATRAEIMASVDSGYPELERLARLQGAESVAMLEAQRAEMLALVPAAA